MRSINSNFTLAVVLLGVAMYADVASAQPASTPSSASKPAASVNVAGMGRGVDAAALAGMSGGTNISERITLNGNVSNNSTEDVSTGLNAIGGGAFANAVGLPMVIQNSGNSVLIQNATIIDVQIQQ